MAVLALGCKAALAVLLLAAGGAKLADLDGFAVSVALFLPRRATRALPGALALAIAIGEVAAGAASLAIPRAWWLNIAVLGICAAFAAVSAAGYIWHRGRSCRCFGALSGRGFGLAGIGRAAAMTAAAAIALAPVHGRLVAVGLAGQAGLLAGGALIAVAAYSAAVAAGVSRRAGAGWA